MRAKRAAQESSWREADVSEGESRQTHAKVPETPIMQIPAAVGETGQPAATRHSDPA